MRSRRPSQDPSISVRPAQASSKETWDAADRHRSEQAIRQSQARLSAVLETAVDAIITIDDRGMMQSVNAATTRIFGYAASELVGRNVSMLMPSPYQQEHDGYLARYLSTGEKRIIGIGREVQARRKDGTTFPVDLAVSEVEPGKLFTGIIRDISDRKLSEARLRESDRMASIGALAAGLGHDMNNVLLPVRAHLNALQAATGGRDAEREHLNQIHKGVSYLQQLADGLHYLAMDPDQITDVEGTTDLTAWWGQTGPLLSKAVPKHVKVLVSFPPDLPPVAVAAHSLTQAILNLIVNAGEAIPGPPQRKRRQGYVRLWAKLEPDASLLRLGVTDNGTGMTQEVKRRAFDMFFTTKPRGLGTGLGLALVQKVVDRAGGTVEIESEPGKGTTFIMNLPVARDRTNSNILAVVSIQDGRAASLVRNLLEASGAKVKAGTKPGRADIWVMDVSQAKLPELNSWRKHCPASQLIMVGDANIKDFQQAIQVNDPADFEAVRSAVETALSRIQ